MHIRLHEAKYIASFEKAAERHLGQSRWKYEDRGARGTLPPRTKNGNVRSGRVLKVRTPVSSSCLFCAFFSNSPGRGVGTCEECDTKNLAYRPDIRAKRTDVLFPVACEIGDRFIAPFAISIRNRQSGSFFRTGISIDR